MQFGDHVPTSQTSRQWKFAFGNGFGASVINDGYGRESRMYELAVLDASEKITYETPITDDVLGWLSESDVAEALDRIKALSADDVAAEIAQRANEARDQRIAELRAEIASLEAEAVQP